MQDEQRLPTWLLTRIWFFANCILVLIVLILGIIQHFLNKNNDDSIGLYFAAIFIGFFISSPSLISLMVANSIFTTYRFPSLSIKKYLARIIIIINTAYLIFSFIYFEVSLFCFIFYTITTAAGLLSLYLLTKKYLPENEP